MIKKCVICGAEFKCSPSDKIVTCSPECRSKRRSDVLKGRIISDETKKKISQKASQQDRSAMLSKGTPAAQMSPKSGRFDTNINAKDWVLISPEGKRYECHSLINFIRKNPDLFGLDGSEESAKRFAHGIMTIKGNILHNRKGQTHFGWTVDVK